MTRAHRASFSRLLACLYWARPDVECPDDPPGPKARIGTLVHRLAEGHTGLGRSFSQEGVDLHELSEAMSIFHGPLKTWVEAWSASPGEHFVEFRVRYDAEADIVWPVPRRDEPGYLPPDVMQMTGELDFVTVLPTHIESIDLKTGQKANSLESQLRGYAILAQRHWDRPLVKSAFLYARKTKVELTPWIEMDVDAIDAEAGALRRALRTLPQAEPIKGEHCWRCPMGPKRGANAPRSTCPQWQDDGYHDPGPPPAGLYDDAVNLF
jgi:hypothetical protein